MKTIETQIIRQEGRTNEREWLENLPKPKTPTTLEEIEKAFAKCGNWIELS